MGSKSGHRIDYNGVGVLRRQRQLTQVLPTSPLRGEGGGSVPYISHFHVLGKTGTFTLYSTFLSIRWGRQSSSFINTHKHSRITYILMAQSCTTNQLLFWQLKLQVNQFQLALNRSDKNTLGAIEELTIPCILWIKHVGIRHDFLFSTTNLSKVGGGGGNSIMKVTCMLGGKFLKADIVKNQNLVQWVYSNSFSTTTDFSYLTRQNCQGSNKAFIWYLLGTWTVQHFALLC